MDLQDSVRHHRGGKQPGFPVPPIESPLGAPRSLQMPQEAVLARVYDRLRTRMRSAGETHSLVVLTVDQVVSLQCPSDCGVDHAALEMNAAARRCMGAAGNEAWGASSRYAGLSGSPSR